MMLVPQRTSSTLDRQGVDGAREPFGTLTDSVGLEETVDDHGRESFHSLELFDVADLGQFVDTQYRRRQDDLVAVVRALGEQVVLAPIVTRVDVTSSSRIASSGGFVTWRRAA